MALSKRPHTLHGTKEARRLPDLDFADDVALITPGGCNELAALTRLKRAGEEVGLLVSREKTKVMAIEETSLKVMIGSEAVECMNKSATLTPQNSWLGHVVRMNETRIPRCLYFWDYGRRKKERRTMPTMERYMES